MRDELPFGDVLAIGRAVATEVLRGLQPELKHVARAANSEPIVLGARDAARRLGMSEKTVWNRTIPRGDIPSVTIGTRVLYDPADRIAWIERMKQRQPSSRFAGFAASSERTFEPLNGRRSSRCDLCSALSGSDIGPERARMHVRSPKTKQHEGGASRTVPLFPEWLPYLEECFDAAEAGAQFVISRYRNTKTNLRIPLLRIIKRATSGNHGQRNAQSDALNVRNACNGPQAGSDAQDKTPVLQRLTGQAASCDAERWSLLDSNQ